MFIAKKLNKKVIFLTYYVKKVKIDFEKQKNCVLGY